VSEVCQADRYQFSGTSDVAIVLKQSARIDQPAGGLRIVFELKRNASQDEHYQALLRLLLSNLLSDSLKPIVVVTDLNEHYCFYWLDDPPSSTTLLMARAWP